MSSSSADAEQVATPVDFKLHHYQSYRVLRDSPHAVIQALRRWRPTEGQYYHLRDQSICAYSRAELAARFFFLNRYCFNGLYRTNMKGKFNVPFGSPQRHHPIDENQLIDASKLLKRARLINADFMHTLDEARTGDFVYLDPPYALLEKRVFKEYLANSFNVSDIERLKSGLAALDRRGVAFVITCADCAEARVLMAGWNPQPWQARRNIAGFASNRKFTTELIASNRMVAS